MTVICYKQLLKINEATLISRRLLMKKIMLLLLALLSFGCAQNRFNVPVEDFSEKVKSLGVLPIAVDAGSDIRHPQKEQLIQLMEEMNRKYEQQLVRKLKGTGNFNTVAIMDGDPKQLFENLVSRRERRNDATIEYNKYFWKNDELKNYLTKNKLDAVMVLVVSGLTKNDKVSSSTLLASLTSNYNYLVLSAQILDASGTTLWEYPNFRSRLLTYDPLINLQYPDFSEADANMVSKASVKFKSLDGIRKKLDEKRKDLLLRETSESDAYSRQFDEILSYLKYDQNTDKKSSVKSIETPVAPAEQSKPPATAPVATQTTTVPAAAAQSSAPTASATAPATGSKSPSNEIAPAAGQIF